MPDLEFKLSAIAEQFDVLFECKYWAPHLKLLFQQLYNKKMQLVFCPHGQSDKGYQTPLFTSLCPGKMSPDLWRTHDPNVKRALHLALHFQLHDRRQLP